MSRSRAGAVVLTVRDLQLRLEPAELFAASTQGTPRLAGLNLPLMVASCWLTISCRCCRSSETADARDGARTVRILPRGRSRQKPARRPRV